jgi:hypothetical protein
VTANRRFKKQLLAALSDRSVKDAITEVVGVRRNAQHRSTRSEPELVAMLENVLATAVRPMTSVELARAVGARNESVRAALNRNAQFAQEADGRGRRAKCWRLVDTGVQSGPGPRDHVG